MLPLKIGEPLKMSDVRSTLERLYATGRYADIQVDAEPLDGGVLVRFFTKNTWFIGRVSAGGNLFGPAQRRPDWPTRRDWNSGSPTTKTSCRTRNAVSVPC